MFLEGRIRELCENIIACQDDAQAIVLAQELRSALHQRIEELRIKVAALPSPDVRGASPEA